MKWSFEPSSHIDEYLPAIASAEEFIIKRDADAGIAVINYLFNSPNTFPDPMGFEGDQRRLMVLRRDCRGIKFDLKTGEIVSKPYHKFHNANEKPETQIGLIDWSKPHVILEKLDGSMMTPFKKDGVYLWHSKMGPTDVAKPVNRFAEKHYYDFYESMCEEGVTPIFEWCSRQQRIVIDYPKDQLILTALRRKREGTYLPYSKMVEYGGIFGIPVVRALPGNVVNAQQFLDETADIEGAEGFVVRFDDGHMCKVKGSWYCRIHNTKEIFVFEKNVWSLILNDTLDDAKPFMDDKDRNRIEDFANEFDHKVKAKAACLQKAVEESRIRVAGDRKKFALEVAPTFAKEDRSMLFRIWTGDDPVVVVRNFLSSHCGTQSAIDSVRHVVDGLDWRNFYDVVEYDD